MERLGTVRNRQTGEYEELCLLNGQQWVVRDPQTRRTRPFDDNAYERIAPAASSTMFPPQRPLMPALTQPVSNWGVSNITRNQAESHAAGLEQINRDKARSNPQAPGYRLAAYLLDQNLTYGLAAPRFQMSESMLRHAVLHSTVSSEYDKQSFEQIGITDFIVNRSLAQ